ncbi:bifunctional acetate--CoA ligase family protein/GNAT family N-acetyltransferase [Actinacidiphila bryophytorum]|uniref:GNAT family N-acetyltransferase n=1 Tax=Actinacidiphila bryophytorum TaxID=1436133 RepID=A0A9W4MCZ5_9ACTN|nr:GNAT family N-acetyltransferase [Actinacidiphila bryophytorum]MBM9437044.1 GNAT family N-acetyltransferase [Actinacidiphila bryophytorum]MBN6541726.1 GNAT family N-acetyltransferase [Actinacidiphila bryophytorum]CAG7646381.1 GNAT family N-acetyltransferase [Actinacidiphila bryophytorum]
MTYAKVREPAVHALLADGETVGIRPALPGDRERVRRLYAEMSPESLRMRFFGVSRRAGEQAADRLCEPAGPGHRSLLALREGRVIGAAEYLATDDPEVAEIDLAVADDFHHRGVGTLLLEHLANAAREAGVTSFTADALASNALMQRLVADLGLTVERRRADGETHVTIGLTPDERFLAAVDLRGSTADVASLRPLLRPRSVAVVGAGTSPGSVGRAVLRKIKESGFTGRLRAVNPHARSVLGVPCFPSAADLPQPPDLAVLAVPAASVPEVAEQCGAAGVRALVVLSSGLDEDLGAALLQTCRSHGMRLVGPNCLGVAVTDEDIRLDATFAAHGPLPGTAGVAVQSGGIGIALLEGLARLGIGVSDFVSLGDKYDVSGNDLLQFWEDDGRTRMALLHLESFGNPRAFSRTARRVARRMPVLTVDAGRSDAGRRAAASHSAAAATPTMTRQALFTQAGVTATRSVAELLDTAALLHSQPLPGGSRVAVVSNAGGAAVLAADACAEAGFDVPELPADLVAELLGGLPAGASAGNPVDTTAAVGEDALSGCLDLLTGHGAVDAVLVVLVPTAVATATGEDLLRALTHADPRDRPRTVAAVLLGQAEQVRLVQGRGRTAIPAFADPRAAARALAHAAERARWLARPHGSAARQPGSAPAAARAFVGRFLDTRPEGGWLDPGQCAELLAHYAVPQLSTALARSEDDAVTAARELTGGHGRVAVKAYWPGLLHKSERDAVLLDLEGPGDVREAYRELAARFAGTMTGVVVQPMAGRGTELVAGVVQDEVFGPLVLFGLGGTATEVLADHGARLAPLTDRDVHELIASRRCAPLLLGRDGAGAVDLDGLELLLRRLSEMACDLPQLAEADLNPVVARHDGVVAVDVRIRLTPRHPVDPYLRRLR